MKQNYYVTLRVEARYITKVEANDIDEAKQMAMDNWIGADIGDLEDTTGEVVVIEDETGDYIYEK